MRWDAAVYYLLGTSLAEGKGYRLPSEPGEIQAIQYPPLLPAIVAAHQVALGTNDPRVVGQALRLAYFALTLAYLAAVYLLARQFLPSAMALPLSLGVSVYVQTVALSNLLFSEIPFALFTVAFALCHHKAPGWLNSTTMGVLGISSYLLRSAGLALLGAWLFEAALRREWRQLAIRTCIALIPVVSWQGYVRSVQTSDEFEHPAYSYQREPYQYYNVTYSSNLMMVDSFFPELGRATPLALARRFFGNLATMPAHLGEGCIGGRNIRLWLANQSFRPGVLPAWIAVQATNVVGAMVIFGTALMASRREWLISAYIALSVALVCATPWPGQFSRYLTPVMPFLLLALGESWKEISRFTSDRMGGRSAGTGMRIVVFLFWLVVAKNGFTTLRTFQAWQADRAAFGSRLAEGVDRLFYFDAAWVGFDSATAWIRSNTKPGDVVASSTPQWVYLRAGRKAVMPPMEAETARVQALLDSVPVRYMIVDGLSHSTDVQRFLKGPVETFPGRWKLVYSAEMGGARIYRRAGPPS